MSHTATPGRNGRHTGTPTQAATPRAGEAEKESVADQLIGLGMELELFHDPDRIPYAMGTLEGKAIRALPMKPHGVGQWLRRRFFEQSGKGVPDGPLATALGTLGSLALYQGECHPVFVRLGYVGEAIYLDLGNKAGDIVEITKDGWSICPAAPVRFAQPRGMEALPRPRKRGKIDPLWGLLNVPEQDRVLVAAWLLMALNPHGPYPGLFISGEQGSAKTTTARNLRGLIDPNKCLMRNMGGEEETLVLAARNALILGLDNLSTISQEKSDALCRIMTGGGLGKRQLFTDEGEIIWDVKRPVLVTGIPDLANPGDLADRVISLHLQPLAKGKRMREKLVKKRYEAAHPSILGALLDAVSLALAKSDEEELEDLGRMADFEAWANAGLPALGFQPEEFFRVYRGNRKESASNVLEGSAVGIAIRAFLKPRPRWEGTSEELLEELQKAAPEAAKKRKWPETPRGLRSELTRLAPAFERSDGWKFIFGERRGHDRERIVKIERSRPKEPSAPSADSEWSGEIPW
jgi:putative DNA primase/helicase